MTGPSGMSAFVLNARVRRILQQSGFDTSLMTPSRQDGLLMDEYMIGILMLAAIATLLVLFVRWKYRD